MTTVTKEATFAADLIHHPIATDGDYMIVDLTGGTNAAVWRVTYMSDVADPAATFNTDEYKTTKLVLKKVNAGSFWMGSESDPVSEFYDEMATLSGNNNEAPRHYVTLTKNYFLQLFQLTSAQYELMTGEMTAYNKEHYPSKPKLTAGGISKAMTRTEAFPIAALNRRARCAGMAHSSFDLPTEAQWEYACRAGTTTRFFFGNDPEKLADYAWYKDKVTKPSWNHALQEPGLLLPNPWDFYDMYGNIGELVKDDLGAYHAGDETNPIVDPCFVNSNASMIFRGGTGGWGEAKGNRSAARHYTGSTSQSCGIRLAFTCN